jgi:biotin synthase
MHLGDEPGRRSLASGRRWTHAQARSIHDLPMSELLFRAHTVHRQHFDPNVVQISTLLSIKTGACPEDCAYCPQSVHYAPGRRAETLMEPEAVVAAAREAKACGATRFCMGAAWRSPRQRDLDQVVAMVAGVKALGMETCATLGMLTRAQARALADAGLDYYNHNLDTSPEYYAHIISTRTYQDRLDTLEHVRAAGLRVCCGGIIGMGEDTDDRIGLLLQLANLPEPPESVPINLLVQVEGTPLYGAEPVDPLAFVRTVALARILMPRSWVRLSAGREQLSDEMHALCFLAGANSVFYGEKLLTTRNSATDRDRSLFARLGVEPHGSLVTGGDSRGKA